MATVTTTAMVTTLATVTTIATVTVRSGCVPSALGTTRETNAIVLRAGRFLSTRLTRWAQLSVVLGFVVSCTPLAEGTSGHRAGAGAWELVDVAHAAGVSFVHENGADGRKLMPETIGSGGAFFHHDNDDWVDLLLVNGSTWSGRTTGRPATPHLYRNTGDWVFEDVTVAAGLDFTVYGMGVAVADYDADGDSDLYITAVGENRLLRNDDGRYVDVTAATGTGGTPASAPHPAWSTSAAWLDADGDGWLDLFVCNYVQWTVSTDRFMTKDGTNKAYSSPQLYPGESCVLYRNLEGVAFEDVTDPAGLANPFGKSLGVAVDDFNGDGWIDIVVANDIYPNFLYENQGDGTFRDVALAAGVAVDPFGRARAGMGIDVTDVMGRDQLSIAIGNFSREAVSLYTQTTSDRFEDFAAATRLVLPTTPVLTFGLVFADLNLDGHPELILANGHVESDIAEYEPGMRFAQSPSLFVNTGRGAFYDASKDVGEQFSEAVVGRGLAAADVDRDGDLDLLLTVNGGRPRLFRNDVEGGERTVRVTLVGRWPNREAFGAFVWAYVGDKTQRHAVRTGSSFLSQSETNPVLIPLRPGEAVDSIRIRWPDQSWTTWGTLDAGASVTVSQPDD